MISIPFDYQKMFTISVLHDYYREEKNTDFILTPSKESTVVASSMSLIIKQINNNIIILYEKAKLSFSHSSPFKDLKLSFYIYSTNNFFTNFTQLPIEAPIDKILYFSNRKNKNSNIHSNIIHKEEYVTERDYVDLSCISTSIFKKNSTKKALAVVDIFISELIENDFKTQDYLIKFAARKTYWKYAFIEANRLLGKEAELVSADDSTIKFSRRDNEILRNKREACIFISEDTLALKQFNTLRLKLISKNNIGKMSDIIPVLPLPLIDMVLPESRKLETPVFSEVVVYL